MNCKKKNNFCIFKLRKELNKTRKQMSKKKEPKMSYEDAEVAVKQYMISQNKPYNSKMVCENLHGQVKLNDAIKIMDELSDSGVLISKINGKQKIYWPNQDKVEGFSQDATRDLESKRKDLKSEVDTLKEQHDKVEKENKRLKGQLSNEVIEEQLKKFKAEVSELEKRYNNIKDNKVVIDPKKKDQLLKKATEYQTQWKKRKRLAKDIADMMTEASGMKISKFYEKLGIETDEDVGFTIDKLIDFNTKK